MSAVMCERLPLLSIDRDTWTRRMMRWHFSEETGSRFWLERRADLGFDPISEVDSFESLRLFGFFDKSALRQARTADLVPRGFADRPRRVFETGGTTGAPCRIVDVTRGAYDVIVYAAMLEARGLAGGDVLAMTPSGPHAYGHFALRLADSWCGNAFAIDFDPRWVKTLLRGGQAAEAYVEHLVAQTESILETQQISLLFTTSKLLLALAPRLRQPLAAYGVRAVCTGGTSCSAEEERHLREEHLGGVAWIDTYGNTLVGHALQADPLPLSHERSYHLVPPFAFLRVSDPHDPWRDVAVGERGRVVTTTLLEDLFLPNLIERDTAIRTGPHPWFPWDGVARVQPLEAVDGIDATEGVY